jgi:PEP-CTERM motif
MDFVTIDRYFALACAASLRRAELKPSGSLFMDFKHKVLTLAALAVCGAAHAGPFILAGTDADDHGSVSAGVNQDGWFFMQRALENLAPGVTNSNTTVYVLGSSLGEATNAATSAFNLSSLAGAGGWTLTFVDGVTDITNFFGVGGGLSSAGIIMLDSGSNVGGGITGAELTVLSTNAGLINSFVGGGGGLFSQANGYSWLQPLVPGIVVNSDQESGLALTAAGNAAFPGLTNSDLSSGPYHQNFDNFGAIPVLATGIGSFAGYDVILGASGGSITDPTVPPPIPEPSTYALMLAGLGLVAYVARRRREPS